MVLVILINICYNMHFTLLMLLKIHKFQDWVNPTCLTFKIFVCVHAKLLQLCLTLCDPMDCIVGEAPLSVGLSRQFSQFWSGLPCPTPRDLTHWSNPFLLCLLNWQPYSLPLAPLGKPHIGILHICI